MDEETQRMMLYMLLLSVLLIIVIINTLPLFYESVPTGFDCYYENAIVNSVYVDRTDWLGGGDCREGCLFMRVWTEHIYFLPCGHIDKIVWENRTYFFANELKSNLRAGDNITVMWCWIPGIQDRRIRQVTKR